MNRRITAAALAILTATGIGVANASSAQAAPGYIGPKYCYMKTTLGYDKVSRMVATAWPYNGGRRYHLAFYEDVVPPYETNWSEFYMNVNGTWVTKAGSSSSDSMPAERYVDMPTNVTHTLNAKWTRFTGGIPVGWSYCYGTKPVL